MSRIMSRIQCNYDITAAARDIGKSGRCRCARFFQCRCNTVLSFSYPILINRNYRCVYVCSFCRLLFIDRCEFFNSLILLVYTKLSLCLESVGINPLNSSVSLNIKADHLIDPGRGFIVKLLFKKIKIIHISGQRPVFLNPLCIHYSN